MTTITNVLHQTVFFPISLQCQIVLSRHISTEAFSLSMSLSQFTLPCIFLNTTLSIVGTLHIFSMGVRSSFQLKLWNQSYACSVQIYFVVTPQFCPQGDTILDWEVHVLTICQYSPEHFSTGEKPWDMLIMHEFMCPVLFYISNVDRL